MTRARSSLPYRRARAALVLGAAAFVVGELAIFSFGAMTRPDTVAPPSLEYALVLGAHVRNDGPSNILKNRLDTALVYMNANPDVVLIASGGQGADEPTTEARAMRDYLVERGADPKRIICEERSRNTFENIANSSPLIEDGARVALITSDFHMLRAVMIARRFGMNPFVISAPTPLDVAAGCYSREFFGLIKSFLFDRPRAS